LADQYVSTGAGSTLRGVGNSRGGLYSATSYVSVGQDAIVGAASPSL
jgi:hypothetical protein